MQSSSLLHNHICLGRRGLRKDGGSLKLGRLDEPDIATVSHMQVAHDIGALNIGSRVIPGTTEVLNDSGALSRILHIGQDCGYIAQNHLGVNRVSAPRGHRVQAVDGTKSTSEADTHTDTSASSVLVCHSSQDTASQSGHNAILPDDL